MRRLFVLATAHLLLMLLDPAVASARIIPDPDDVRGRFDVRSVTFTRFTDAQGAVRLRFRWTTYEDWTIRRCRRAQELEDGCLIAARLDTKGPPAWRPTGRGIDYGLHWRPGRCAVFDPDSHQRVAEGIALKGPDYASCTVRRGDLIVRKKIRWYAFMQLANVREFRWTTDHVPDRRWVE
jgi:hypothetical protein